MKRYPEYKDSGIPWMAEVPEHWKTAKLKHVVRFFGGGTPDKSNLDYWTGTIPWVSPKDMKSDHIDDAEDHISEDAVAGSSTKMVDTGAVLMVVRSGILKHTIPVAINRVPVALNQDMKALVPDDELVPNYLRYLIKGEQDNLLLEWRKQGATVESVEQDYVADTVIPLPPVVEQQFISDYLDRKTQEIDDLIQKKQRLIDLLKEQRTAVINRAVTKGLDPNVPMKDSGVEWLGEVPAHWSVTRLKFCVRPGTSISYGIVQPGEHIDGGIPFVQTTNMSTGDLSIGSLQRTSAEIAKSYPRTRLEENDIILGIRASVGEAHIVPRSLVGANVSRGIARIAPSQFIRSEFLYWYLNSKNARRYWSLVQHGSTFEQVPIMAVKELPVLLPSIEEQDAIVRELDEKTADIDTIIQREAGLIDRLKEFRTSLISEVVTGKIDVREGVEEAVPTEP